ncbi:hypothetical protein RFZ01_02435, partial [Acinetobacter pittii]|nr:hypothetical protein [Acinetobacter pittii]
LFNHSRVFSKFHTFEQRALITKQAHHEQRLGLSNEAEIKANIEKAQQEKLAKDQALNLEKQKQLEE